MIDGASVPPATSSWTVLATAAAAFFGVVVAQWWTTRREDRNWQRQLQMYAQQWEDQRTRDAEEREGQRRLAVDQKLWDSRASFYLELLTLVDKIEIYAIERHNEIVATAFEPDLHEDEDRDEDGEYPKFPSTPDQMEGKLAIFASPAVARLARIVTFAAEVLRHEQYDPKWGSEEQFAGSCQSILEFTLKTTEELEAAVRSDLQEPPHATNTMPHPRVTAMFSWKENHIKVDEKVIWRGFITDAPPPGLHPPDPAEPSSAPTSPAVGAPSTTAATGGEDSP